MTQDKIQDNIEPHILKEEFEITLKELKENKSPGIDNLNRELLKVGWLRKRYSV